MRLTFKEPDGKWGIVGMNKENEEQKMYDVACKLKDYEETGLSPQEVENLKSDAVSTIIFKLKEKQIQIMKELDKDSDTFERLSKFKEHGDIETAIRVLNKLDR